MNNAFLTLQQVSYHYPDTAHVVSAIDWSVPSGAFHCLLGRSGCGKSTLLKLAAGLLAPTSGHITQAGSPVHGPSLATSFVFQSPTLLDWLSVIDNVLLPLSLRGRPNATDTATANALLIELGLHDMQHKQPQQLSGGEQSRVAIARALITQPSLLLMDEPFAALDALTREALQDSLLAVCHQHGITVLFVTHDISEAVYLSDHIAVMKNGRIDAEQDITLARPRAPSIRHSAAFNAACVRLRSAMENTP